MFRPNCRAIFRLIFEKVECTIVNIFNVRNLVSQELVEIKDIGANGFVYSSEL